jgi:hypothetical protein
MFRIRFTILHKHRDIRDGTSPLLHEMKENRSFVPWLSPVSVSLEKNYRTRVADHVRNQRSRHGFGRSVPLQKMIRKVKTVRRSRSSKFVMYSRFSAGTGLTAGCLSGLVVSASCTPDQCQCRCPPRLQSASVRVAWNSKEDRCSLIVHIDTDTVKHE